jgi:hypothetical protein
MSRTSDKSAAIAEEPTPEPASAVSVIASAPPPSPPPSHMQRRAALLAHFADPSPEMRRVDEAWEEALALYGDEDSDAWVAALEDGSHPLCRVGAITPAA